MLVNQFFDLGIGHFLVRTLPVPWHILHLRYPLFPPVLRLRDLVLTFCVAIENISVITNEIVDAVRVSLGYFRLHNFPL